MILPSVPFSANNQGSALIKAVTSQGVWLDFGYSFFYTANRKIQISPRELKWIAGLVLRAFFFMLRLVEFEGILKVKKKKN